MADNAYLKDLPSLVLIQVADLVVGASLHDWKTIGLYFERSHNFVIKEDQLKATYGNESPQYLCRRLFEELAKHDIKISELGNALRHIGLVSTAGELNKIANSALNPPVDSDKAPVKLTEQEVYNNLQKYRDAINSDPSKPHPKLSTILEQQKMLYGGPKMIYGQDSRVDIYKAPGYQKWADSVCGLWTKNQVQIHGSEVKLTTAPFTKVPHNKVMKDLAPDVAFYKQPRGPFGSAFLVDKDVVVTAGHCVSNDAPPISEVYFVFNFRMISDTEWATVTPDDVYEGTVEKSELNDYQDWAIIRLKRAVVRRDPLTFEQGQTNVVLNEELSMIGHPYGLPLKMASKAEVTKIDGHFIYAKLDAFGGNSGSPVFNAHGTVVGILVRGGPDFEWSDEKQAMIACNTPITGFVGETVMKIASVPVPEKVKPKEAPRVILVDVPTVSAPPALSYVSDLKPKQRGAIARLISLRGAGWKTLAEEFDLEPKEIEVAAKTDDTLECCRQLLVYLGGMRIEIAKFKQVLTENSMQEVVQHGFA